MIKAFKKSTKRQFSKSSKKLDAEETLVNHIGPEIQICLGEEGCFFNAVSKCLQSAGIANAPSVQQLREECLKYAKENAWVKDKIIEDARKRSSSNNADDQTIWHTYWFAVRYTTSDIERLKINEVVNDKTIYQSLVAAIKGRPEIEGQIICKQYGVSMHVLDAKKSKEWSNDAVAIINDDQSKSEVRGELDEKGHVIHVLSTGSECYEAVLENHCCDKEVADRDNEDNNVTLRLKTKDADKTSRDSSKSTEYPSIEVDKRLNEFTMQFVKEFEAKLASYILIGNGEMTKFTKISEPFFAAVGQVSGGIIGGILGQTINQSKQGAAKGGGVGKALGSILGTKVGKLVDKNTYKTKLANLSEILSAYQKDKLKFRKSLTEVGADIFQSFELQFVGVDEKKSSEGMQLLARDAMNRAVNYLCNNKTDKQMLTMQSAILDGVLQGKSKPEAIFGYEVGNPLTKPNGFSIACKLNDKQVKWNSANLFEEVGLVLEGENTRSYFKDKIGEKNVKQYGYRRCFSHEKWEELKDNYVESCENDDFNGYSYVFKLEQLQNKSKIIFNQINNSEMSLGELRTRELLEESQKEILDELSMLKTISGQLENDSKILESIEYNIKNLKFDEYFEKLNDQLSEVMNEVKAGRDENRKSFKQLNEKLDEIQDAIKIKAKNEEVFDSSIQFNFNPPSNSFSGRVDILKQIQKDLEKEIVVICGLGGVGKSALVYKYVRERFTDRDNVIWIDAETSETIAKCCQRLGQLVGLKATTDDNAQQLNLIFNKILEHNLHRKLILIIDNAPNYAIVQPIVSLCSKINARAHVQMIITTRNSTDWKGVRLDIKAIQLKDFTRPEAVNFVKSALPNDMNVLEYEINSIVDLLHCFPMALQQAIVYIRNLNEDYKKRKSEFSITDYVNSYKKNPKKFLDAKQPNASETSVYQLINSSIKKISGEVQGEKAILILKLISFMASEKIPEEIFLNVIDNKNLEDLIATIKLLEMNSLVDVNDGLLSVQGMVQEVTRIEMTEQEERRMLAKVLRLLIKQIKESSDVQDYKTHILSIWNFACKHDRLIEKYVINYVGNATAYTPFLHLLVDGDRIEVAKEIINRVQINHPGQLQKVINDKDKNGDRLLNYASKNQQMAQFLLEKLAG